MASDDFMSWAQRDPTRPAVIEARGREWTRHELAASANSISRAFKSAGLRPGDSIALLAPNCAEFLAIYLGALHAGLYVVPVNWHLRAPEVAHILRTAEVRAVAAHSRMCRLMKSALELAGSDPLLQLSIGEAEGLVDVATVTAQFPGTPLDEVVLGRPRLFTSATTGLSKAIDVPLDTAAFAQQKSVGLLKMMFEASGISAAEDGMHLCTSVLYHGAPLDCAVAALHLGQGVVLMDQWDPQEMLRLIERYGVTTACVVPSMFVRLLKLPEDVRSRYTVTSLRFVSHGGAPCPTSVKHEMIKWWGPVLWELYGAAEGSGTNISPWDWLRFPGSVGKPHPGSEIRIFDDDGSELPPGVSGNVYIRRYTGDRFEYHGDPERTRAAYRGEFFTAGDIGYLNEEGFLFICDRKSDMIISGGANVYPAEIEQTLLAHSKVRDCAVFGVPDDLMGEAAHAVVVPALGVEPSTLLTSELMSFVTQQLSAQKLPRRIEYMDELPREPSGKLYKRRLRDPHWIGRERKV